MNAELASPLAPGRPNPVRRLYNWTLGWAEHPGGSWALFWIAFAEASFFPIPPDVLLLALCAGSASKAFRFALICSTGSVLGGMFGYLLGAVAWQTVEGWLIPLVFSQALFDQVQGLYHQNAFLAIVTAAFTPIPYKVFTVAAGAFEVNFLTLVSASALGRSTRFFLVAGILYYFGAPVKQLLEKHFDRFAWALLVLGVGGFLALKLA